MRPEEPRPPGDPVQRLERRIIRLHQGYARRIQRLQDQLAAAEARADQAERRELETMASSERIATRLRKQIGRLKGGEPDARQ